MLQQERVFAVLQALGGDISYQEANQWIKRKFGEGVSDATFYNGRKAYRATNAPSAAKHSHKLNIGLPRKQDATSSKTTTSENNVEDLHLEGAKPSLPEGGGSSQVQEQEDFTFSELHKVASFAKSVGGRDRLQRILATLEALQ